MLQDLITQVCEVYYNFGVGHGKREWEEEMETEVLFSDVRQNLFIFVSLQGLYQLLETSVVIRTRSVDVANVKVS